MPAITIGEVRLSYVNVFQARAQSLNAEPKFSVTVLLPKSDTHSKQMIDAAIEEAIQAGVGGKWNGQRPPQPQLCIHDGDGVRPSDGQPYGQECKGHWVFTASCSADRPSFIVDNNVQPIINQADVYSGMYGYVNVSFFPYLNTGKRGVGCGLNGVQKTRDGEPLASRITADEAFKPQGQPTYGQPPAPAYGQQPPAINPFTRQPM